MLLVAIAPTSVAANGLSTFLVLTRLDGFLEVLWANCTTLELLPTLGAERNGGNLNSLAFVLRL
ncbi:MAG: hypothetical protein ACR2II_12920 [Chthoniobacterales bacterium]